MIGLPAEERSLHDEVGEDETHTEHIDFLIITILAKQNLWGLVEFCANAFLVPIIAEFGRVGEISENSSGAVHLLDEEMTRFYISVHDLVVVQFYKS